MQYLYTPFSCAFSLLTWPGRESDQKGTAPSVEQDHCTLIAVKRYRDPPRIGGRHNFLLSTKPVNKKRNKSMAAICVPRTNPQTIFFFFCKFTILFFSRVCARQLPPWVIGAIGSARPSQGRGTGIETQMIHSFIFVGFLFFFFWDKSIHSKVLICLVGFFALLLKKILLPGR